MKFSIITFLAELNGTKKTMNFTSLTMALVGQFTMPKNILKEKTADFGELMRVLQGIKCVVI